MALHKKSLFLTYAKSDGGQASLLDNILCDNAGREGTPTCGSAIKTRFFLIATAGEEKGKRTQPCF